MLECTPVPPYLFLSRADRPIDRLRRCLIATKWRRMGSWRRKVGFVGAVVGWPIIAAALAWREVGRHGPTVRRLTGQSRWRQLVDQWLLASWYGTPPHAYYTYELFLPNRRELAVEYLHSQELYAVSQGLNRNSDASVLEDKVAFAKFCQKEGLPTIPILAVFEDGKVVEGDVASAADLPEVDLFAKLTDAARGKGIRAWKWLGEGRYESSDGAVVAAQQVIEELLATSKERPVLLQRRVKNHSQLRRVSKGGLCTVRMVAGQQTSGEMALVAFFRMAVGDSLTDNFSGGGIASLVDEHTGTLGPATTMAPNLTPITHHPDTGETIEGISLPFWEEAKQLCFDVQNRLPDFSFVGWDIAIGEEGPMLVEGNPYIGARVIQKASGIPIGRSALCRVFLDRFEAKRSATPHPS